MVPLRLLIISPFCMVKVLLLFWLVVAPSGCGIFVDALINVHSITAIVHVVFNIISLSTNWITENFIRFLNFFEHLTSLMLLSLGDILPRKEIRMVLLCHLVIGELNVFLFGLWFNVKDRVQILFFFSKMKHYSSRLIQKHQSRENKWLIS